MLKRGELDAIGKFLFVALILACCDFAFLRGNENEVSSELASSAGNSCIKARVKDWYGGQKGD